jgi:hypothetical protein
MGSKKDDIDTGLRRSRVLIDRRDDVHFPPPSNVAWRVEAWAMLEFGAPEQPCMSRTQRYAREVASLLLVLSATAYV